MMVRTRSPGQSLFRAVLALFLVAGSGFAVASMMAGGPARLLARDPARADYTWLRQGLERAQKLSDNALEGTRRGGRLAAARALEQAILYSRATARRTETRPIPPEIRERLEGYFPEHVLDKVRWAFPNRSWASPSKRSRPRSARRRSARTRRSARRRSSPRSGRPRGPARPATACARRSGRRRRSAPPARHRPPPARP